MKALRALLACFALIATNASAIIPENGWWWASSESGRGFNIEVQNNLLFFAAFAYQSNGAPTWLTAGGNMTSDRDFTGPLTSYTSGQCFGCAYVAPTPVAAGTLTLRFTSSQTAVLTINGTSMNVKRFDFWQNEIAPDAMLGEWSSVIGANGDIFDGERIVYRVRASDSSGAYLSGFRLGSNTTSNGAVVQYSFSSGRWTALLDSSASFYRLFDFAQTGFNRVEGTMWVYAKGGSPSGSGTFYQAFRTASYAFVLNGTGPASTKALHEGDLAARLEARDRDLWLTFERAGKTAGSVDPEIVERARMLEQRLGGAPDSR